MTYETANYVITYFSRLMTRDEREAVQHAISVSKLESFKEETRVSREALFRKRGWLTSNKEVIALLDQGYEQFILNTATRISQEAPNEFCLNLCPRCEALARTPYARQCRHCCHAWHDVVAGAFKFDSGFRVTGRGYYIAGEIISGAISIGDRLDLSRFQINLFPVINAIEHAYLGSNDPRIEIPTLGIKLTEDQELLIKTFLRKTAIDLHILKAQ